MFRYRSALLVSGITQTISGLQQLDSFINDLSIFLGVFKNTFQILISSDYVYTSARQLDIIIQSPV